MKKTKAFTLIELLVVIVIIGILATVSAPLFSGMIEKARIAKAIGFYGQMKTQMGLHPVVHWDFSSLEGGQMLDKVGGDQNGTITGAIPYMGESALGDGAYEFDGDDQILSSDAVSLGQDFTISLWLKADNGEGGHPFGMHNNFLWRMRDYVIHDRANSIATSASSSWPDYEVRSGKDFVDGKWHHFVFSVKELDLSLYVDGDLIAQDTRAGLQSHSGPISAGRENIDWLPSAYFTGEIDDLIVYSEAFEGLD